VVDLAPFVTPADGVAQDLAPGRTSRSCKQPPPEPPREQKPEEEEKPKIRPPPPQQESRGDAAAGREAQPPKPVPQPEPAEADAPAAPARSPAWPAVTAGNVSIAKQIEQHKGYPPSALPRRESG